MCVALFTHQKFTQRNHSRLEEKYHNIFFVEVAKGTFYCVQQRLVKSIVAVLLQSKASSSGLLLFGFEGG
jgi:hypothetical protein